MLYGSDLHQCAGRHTRINLIGSMTPISSHYQVVLSSSMHKKVYSTKKPLHKTVMIIHTMSWGNPCS